MKARLISLFILISVFTLTTLVGTIATDDSGHVSQAVTLSNSESDSFIFGSQQLDKDNSAIFSKSSGDTIVDSKDQNFSSDNLPLIPNRSSALFFRTAVQEEPIYWLIAEFNPPDLSLFVQPQLKNYLTNKPWYLITQSNSASRVSGWKESNSIYAGRKTFHLFLTHPSIGA
ncbi:hypothetical protein FLL45_15735 [Aliikangiella marina]|uniref:Uncharacterized protein n=1 Tax=Aliikangiella marina TaxID=1712262 RepID=A0A545T6V4_9GAMM|nr:hypothetical protein [Aliikangiella marina]TQV72915.1 hypothetical protein FLL45_15735 [Aliikangiella marina]